MDKISLQTAIKDIYLETATSKAGNSYHRLVIEFKDGYKKSQAVFGAEEYLLMKQVVKGNN